ncbi:MAG: CHRD domain-containing protein [Ignavibacteriales bacterium]|nr:CHRD domain-containing protein [Ignavibacteriales bacterium]
MKNLPIRIVFLFLIIISTSFTGTVVAQTTQSSQTVFVSTINALLEGSSDTSKATATAWAILSGDKTQLTYRITYAKLTSKFTASHFHLGFPGTNGPVVHAIQYTRNTAIGSWTNLPDSIVTALIRGQIYINIHTQNYPGGEIRGQLKPVDGIPFLFSPEPGQVNSPDTSKASGTGWAVLSSDGSVPYLTYGMTIAGLTSNYTASHFHIGVATQNGGVVHPIAFSDSSAYGRWDNISDQNVLALLRDGIYANVHSANYPGGEIRGQLIKSGTISFYASLDGNQEVPIVTTNATGTALFVLNDSLSSLAYRITFANLQDGFTASHFHLGAFGVPGGVVKPINTFKGNTADGIWSGIPDSLLVSLVKGNLYVNIHSKAHGGGEIRGQVWLNEGIAFIASLNSAQSGQSVSSLGSGTSWLSLVDDTLKFQITFAGLTSAYSSSHFHLGATGVNGGVVHPIAFTDSTTNSFWASLDNSSLSALVNKNLYINIHTANYPAGEIRGQVLPSTFESAHSVTFVSDENSSVISNYKLSQNYPNPFNPSTTINFSIPQNSFVTIKVYNNIGKEVTTLVNEQKPTGNYNVVFNGNNLASGVYFYRMIADGIVYTKKLMLLK